MARTVRDAKIETRTARMALAVRTEPHWKALDAGLAMGYRRNKRGGVWLGRRWDADRGTYREAALGKADDAQDADGVTVLSFSQAQAAARDWWRREERVAAGLEAAPSGPYTVKAALADYFEARTAAGSKGVYSDRRYAETRIEPDLGNVELAKLTTVRIRRWHQALASQGKLLRAAKGAEARRVQAVDADDPEAVRSRRATANRVLTVLKAALNHAFREERVAADEAWRKVQPFKEVDAARVRHLDENERARLVAACPTDFRQLVEGALLSGCRYGELIRATVGSFNADSGTLRVSVSKSGKPRHVVLTDDGIRHFGALAANKPPGALLFLRADGEAWGASHQQRPLIAASEIAKVEPAATFHILRHTYASTAVMQGVTLEVIAAQLGHADTRVTSKHYAHLAPSYVADSIRGKLAAVNLAGRATDAARN